MFLSKCLLIKSRKLLVDTTPTLPPSPYSSGAFDLETIYGDKAPASPSIVSQRTNTSSSIMPSVSFSSSSATSASVANPNFPSGSGSATNSLGLNSASMAKTVQMTLNAQLESNTVWQKEMERGYDTLLEAIIPYLGSAAAGSRLQR